MGVIHIYKTLASIIVSLITVYYIFSAYDLNLLKILRQFRIVDYPLAIFSIVVFFVANYLNAVRLRGLLAKQGLFYSNWLIFKFGLVQSFFYSFFPGGVISDLVRISLLIREIKQAYAIFKISILDRIYGFAGLIICFIGILLSDGDVTKLALFSAPFVLGTVLFYPSGAVSTIRLAVYAISISTVTMLVAGCSLYYGVLSVGIPQSFLTIFTLSLIATISAAVPSINGIGVRDFLYILFFGAILSNETAVVISTIVLILNMIMGLLGGVILLFYKQFGVRLNSDLIREVQEEINKRRKPNDGD